MYTTKQSSVFSSDGGLVLACVSGSHRKLTIVQTGDNYYTKSSYHRMFRNGMFLNVNLQSTFQVLFSELIKPQLFSFLTFPNARKTVELSSLADL